MSLKTMPELLQSTSKKRKRNDNANEERQLEEILFGKIDHSSLSETIAKQSQSFNSELSEEVQGEGDRFKDWEFEDINFTIDTTPNPAIKRDESVHNEGPVWRDEDDDAIFIDLNQSNRLKKLTSAGKTPLNKTLVTGSDYTNLLKQRYDTSQKKNVWANPRLSSASSKTSRRAEDEDPLTSQRYLDEEDYQLLQEAESMIANTRGKHPANKWLPLSDGKITMQRLQDITFEEAASSRISATNFHRNNQLVLVASDDKALRLFRIVEENDQNQKVLNMQFNDLSIKSAKFLGSSHEEIIVCGRRPYYYSYNLQSGQVSKIPKSLGMETNSLERMSASPDGTLIGFVGSHGYMHIADSKTKQWTIDLKMNSTLRSMSFLNEYQCVSSGFDADIYLWDLRYPNGKCVSKFAHEDGTATSCLSTYVPSSSSSSYYSLPNAYLSVGSISGVNSIYEGDYAANSGLYEFSSEADYALHSSIKPKPLKSVMNLTTKITSSAFHPSGQVLAIASSEKKDQLKLIHLPSCSVFQNWPVSSTPLHTIQTVEFSPNGEYFIVGNKRGKVLLYRLNHFL